MNNKHSSKTRQINVAKIRREVRNLRAWELLVMLLYKKIMDHSPESITPGRLHEITELRKKQVIKYHLQPTIEYLWQHSNGFPQHLNVFFPSSRMVFLTLDWLFQHLYGILANFLQVFRTYYSFWYGYGLMIDIMPVDDRAIYTMYNFNWILDPKGIWDTF